MLRFKNYGLWVSLFALLGMILLDANIITELGRYEQYIQIVLGLLIAAGVISNPSTGKGFTDK